MKEFWIAIFLSLMLFVSVAFASSYSYNILNVNGTYTKETTTRGEQNHQLTMTASGVTPTARDGSLSVYGRPHGSTDFFIISDMSGVTVVGDSGVTVFDLSDPLFLNFDGDIVEYKFVLSGVTTVDGVESLHFMDTVTDKGSFDNWYGDTIYNY